jgi:putative peptidoglycan lipid II flippase
VQLLYMLPVSLFGMSISAAELPAMASVTGDTAEIAERLRDRLGLGLRRIAFFIVPSAVAFLAFGDLVARLVYEGGEFRAEEVEWAWGVLAGSAVGLLASTLGRLYASALYALRDTRTPLRFAMVRVALTTALGVVASLWLPGALGIDPRWAVAGLTGSAGVAAWVEFSLLRRAVSRRIGEVAIPRATLAALWGCAGVSAAVGWGAREALSALPPFVLSAVVLLTYTLAYGLSTYLAGITQAQAIVARAVSLLRRR